MKRVIIILMAFTWIGTAEAGFTDHSSNPVTSVQSSHSKADSRPLQLAQYNNNKKSSGNSGLSLGDALAIGKAAIELFGDDKKNAGKKPNSKISDDSKKKGRARKKPERVKGGRFLFETDSGKKKLDGKKGNPETSIERQGRKIAEEYDRKNRHTHMHVHDWSSPRKKFIQRHSHKHHRYTGHHKY